METWAQQSAFNKNTVEPWWGWRRRRGGGGPWTSLLLNQQSVWQAEGICCSCCDVEAAGELQKKRKRKEKRRQQTLRSTNSGLSWPFREQILTFIGMPAFCLLSMHMNFFHPHPWTVRNGFMERGLESVIQCYSTITSNQLPSIIFKHLFTPSWVCACLIPTPTTLMHLDL